MCRFLLALAAGVCLPMPHAHSDGAVFTVTEHSAQSAATADQRAIIAHDGGRQTLILQTTYEDPHSEFAWVIPTPSEVTRADVAEVEPKVFSLLRELSEPRALVVSANGGGTGGCFGGGAGPSRPHEQYSGVDIWDQFAVGDYDVAILSAHESAALGQWLGDNGYHVPAQATPALAHYTQRGWFFTALKVRPHTAQRPGSAGTDLHAMQGNLRPIRVSFDAVAPVFPLRISAASTRHSVSVLLYVLAPHRMQGTNFATVPVDVGVWDGTPFGEYYARRFDEALSAAAGPALVVEYAAPLSTGALRQLSDWGGLDPGTDWFLTRLRTRLAPQQMMDDIFLGPADSSDSLKIIARHPDAAGDGLRLAACLLLLAGVVLTGLNRRCPRNWPRALCLALVVVVMVL